MEFTQNLGSTLKNGYAGKTAEVKALLMKYDAGKLSGVKPEDYPALMEEAMSL